MTLDIAVAGCTGALGRRVVREVDARDGCRLVAGLASAASASLGRDVAEVAGLGPCGVAVGADAAAAFGRAGVVIDFSVPAAAGVHAEQSRRTGTAWVLATTGVDPDGLDAVERAARAAPVLVAPNLSPALNLMLVLVEQAAHFLGEDYDAEVLGFAHRRKRDAPSGGALEIADAIARGRGVDRREHAVHARDGDVGARAPGSIGIASLRGGDSAGEHSAFFAGTRERLELTHRVESRDLQAEVAVDAALWLSGRPAGMYRMRDFLDLPPAPR